MNPKNDLQSSLLERILARYPKKTAAVESLMEVLHVNRDGIYRRLRNDTLLNAPEIQALATKFDISLDEVLSGQDNKISFSYNLYDQPVKSFLHYLGQINQHLGMFSHQPGFKVFYSSRELPIFIYKMFPKLLSFKLYVYGLTTWHFDYLKEKKFNFDILAPKDLEVAESTSRIYTSIDSTDFWTPTILEQTLSQIEFMAHAGRFASPDIAFAIGREIIDVVNHCRAMAEVGKKFLPGFSPDDANGNFTLFSNELAGTSNTILAISDHQYGLYNTLDSPNFIYTTNQRICRSVEDWFNKLLNDSVALSVHSGRNRNIYFNKLEQRANQHLKDLEYIFGSYT